MKSHSDLLFAMFYLDWGLLRDAGQQIVVPKQNLVGKML